MANTLDSSNPSSGVALARADIGKVYSVVSGAGTFRLDIFLVVMDKLPEWRVLDEVGVSLTQSWVSLIA